MKPRTDLDGGGAGRADLVDHVMSEIVRQEHLHDLARAALGVPPVTHPKPPITPGADVSYPWADPREPWPDWWTGRNVGGERFHEWLTDLAHQAAKQAQARPDRGTDYGAEIIRTKAARVAYDLECDPAGQAIRLAAAAASIRAGGEALDTYEWDFEETADRWLRAMALWRVLPAERRALLRGLDLLSEAIDRMRANLQAGRRADRS